MAIDISNYETALPGYFTATEASKALGYAASTYISNMCKEHKIKCYKVGTTWLIPSQQIEILAKSQIKQQYRRGEKRI